MISIIIVNYKSDLFLRDLLESIRLTVVTDDYEIIVVLNSRSYLPYADLSVTTVDGCKNKPTYERQWNSNPASFDHARGLHLGYQRISAHSSTVLLVDPDTLFYTRGWDSLLRRVTAERPLLGSRLEHADRYPREFLRPYFLAFSRSRYSEFLVDSDRFEPTRLGDTACQLTYYSVDQGIPVQLLDNSYNNATIRSPVSPGEVALADGRPFFVHRGRSHCGADWCSFVERQFIQLRERAYEN